MGGNAGRKKERKRLKRLHKQRAGRVGGMLAEVRQAAGGELEGCYVNENWREWGQAGVLVARRWKGRLAVAGFFVDLWCAGLKDAWAKAGLVSEDLDEMLDNFADIVDSDMIKVSREEAGRIVAGSIRFARQNGFRLPEHWDRAVAYLGAIDVEGADIRDFGVEGGTKLRWVGPEWELRNRLVGMSVEEFMARPDVEVLTEAEEEASEEEVQATAEAMDLAVNQLAGQIRGWCFERGIRPEDDLETAASLFLTAGFGTVGMSATRELSNEKVRERFGATLEGLLETLIGEDAQEAVGRALEQVLTFVSSEEGMRRIAKSDEPQLE